MEHFYSENWALLLRLLTEDTEHYIKNNIWTLHKHQQANALALFLSHADLATPELNRINVSAMLNGEMVWPCSDEASLFSGAKFPLPFLEEGGFISFPGGWAIVHCRSPQHIEQFDQSIKDILKIIEYLQDISLGKNGYIQPHFIIDKEKLINLLNQYIGITPLDILFPDVVIQEEYVTIPPYGHHLGKLESTYLWQHLLKNLSPEKAFERWLLCVRVQSNSLVPVEFSLLENDEISHFLEQVKLFIESAPELFYSLKTLHKQVVNSYDFVSVVEPRILTVNLSISGDSATDQSQITTEPAPVLKTTVDKLDRAYHFPVIDDPADIDALEGWPQMGYWREPMGGLARLLNECADYAINIDNQALNVSTFANDLLLMAESRPALKYLLFSVLPKLFSRKYTLFLLAKPETCNVAFYHLTHRELRHSFLSTHSSCSELEQIYLDVLMMEYLRASKVRLNNGELLLKMALYLADNCGLYIESKTDTFQYKTLTCFMQKLDDKGAAELGTAFLQISSEAFDTRINRIRERSIYLIGLWLTERLESLETAEHDLLPSLGSFVFKFYQRAFKESIEMRKRDLKADTFFASLPWLGLLKIIGIKAFLDLSKHYTNWNSFLTYDCEHGFYAVSAVRQHLRLLMNMVKYPMKEAEQMRVLQRIINIVCAFGFGTQERNHYLFINVLQDEETDTLKVFSLFLNTVPSVLYEEFSECCIELMPLDSLYILLDRCSIHERKQALQAAILERQISEDEGLSLASLETAFIHACNNGHMELATSFLSAAKPVLERFAEYSDFRPTETVCRWEVYRYKYTLLSAYIVNPSNPQEFEESIKSIPFPEFVIALPNHELFRRLAQDCEQFRRYIIATAYCETEPDKTVRYMQALCEEEKSPLYAYTLFMGHIAAISAGNNTSSLRYALNRFLDQLKGTAPAEMQSRWVASILDIMMQIGAQQQADQFWKELTPEQRRTQNILLPYCKGLIKRGEPLVASQIINDFMKFNSVFNEEDVGVSELIDQLGHALPEQSTVMDIVHAVAESNQRSLMQLRQHYASITNGTFDDYVKITGNGHSKETFLKEIVVEIANELLVRKKNLQSQKVVSTPGAKLNRIIDEDLINDWFTSLFDKQMAEARIGFRDQKRTGRSGSGKSPGESDGLITDNKNRRIAIFEAFRLFSLATTVISEHLDKIAGYDEEALSPVFVVAYCDVDDLNHISQGYHEFISSRDYEGYKSSGQPIQIEHTVETDKLWLCTDIRYRGKREVTFYHLLLNMHCN